MVSPRDGAATRDQRSVPDIRAKCPDFNPRQEFNRGADRLEGWSRASRTSRPAPVTLLPLFGNIVLLADEGRQSAELSPGTTGAFAAHLEHRVEATQDSAFLIVMGGQA
jgi:hypothetical protein